MRSSRRLGKGAKHQPIFSQVNEALYARYNDPPTFKAKPSLKPSYLPSPCLRKQYYIYHKIPSENPFPARKIREFEGGEAGHHVVKGWLKAAGLLIEFRGEDGKVPLHWATKQPDSEFPITAPDLLVRKGKIDGIVVVDGRAWVYEIKTHNEYTFKQLERPTLGHRIQGHFYAYTFEDQLRAGAYKHIPELEGITDVGGVIFLHVNRNTYDVKEFWEYKDPSLFEQILGKIMVVKEHVEAGTLPPKTEDYCKTCAYKTSCKNNANPGAPKVES